MRIRAVTIYNFQSIRQCSFQGGNVLTLLGPNNHGKSNILAALEFALTTGIKPTEDMFYTLRGNDDSTWVELMFNELTDQESTTFNRYLQFDGSFCVRKTAKLLGSSAEVSYNGYVEEPLECWLQSDSIKSLAVLEHFSEKDPEHVPETLRTVVRLAFCGVAEGCQAGDCRLCEHSPARYG